MKREIFHWKISIALSLVVVLLGTGCQSFRWGTRSSEELDDMNKTKAAESHYWPALKPERSMQDPAWTP